MEQQLLNALSIEAAGIPRVDCIIKTLPKTQRTQGFSLGLFGKPENVSNFDNADNVDNINNVDNVDNDDNIFDDLKHFQAYPIWIQ